MVKPVIFGISGTRLTDEEIDLFKKNEAVGFILFARNIESKKQVQSLTSELKSLYPDRDTPIFTDQEGGRVARIKPPVAKNSFPSAEHFAIEYESNRSQTKRDLKASYADLTAELKEFGIDSPCAPVCDLRLEGASDVIGDRSFGKDPEQVIDLCKSAIAGILHSGGIPFIKHIPGHGRATVDSHFDLPIIDTPLSILESTDFAVFRGLANEDVWAMTAHIIYDALDSENTATTSSKVIGYIRENIGFKGKLVSDDLCMYALHGEVGKQNALLKRVIKLAIENHEWKEQYAASLEKIFSFDTHEIGNPIIIEQCQNKLLEIKPVFLESLAKVTKMSLNAGCDIVLHCSGDLEEMQTVCKEL
jgi:beta-N-acetylhexosaminidase